MKFSATILALLFSSLVASNGLSFFNGGQKTLDEKGGPVVGDSPLTYCQAQHDDDLLVLDHVNLTPNPPTAYACFSSLAWPCSASWLCPSGNTLTIEAAGRLLEPLEEGAYVILTVKYGLIKLVNTKQNLCSQVSNVDMECPVEAGPIVIQKDVELPNEIPNVNYLLSIPDQSQGTNSFRENTLFSPMPTPKMIRSSFAWKQPLYLQDEISHRAAGKARGQVCEGLNGGMYRMVSFRRLLAA